MLQLKGQGLDLSATGMCTLSRDRVVLSTRQGVILLPVVHTWSKAVHMRMWPPTFHATVRLLLLAEKFGTARADAARSNAEAMGTDAEAAKPTTLAKRERIRAQTRARVRGQGAGVLAPQEEEEEVSSGGGDNGDGEGVDDPSALHLWDLPKGVIDDIISKAAASTFDWACTGPDAVRGSSGPGVLVIQP